MFCTTFGDIGVVAKQFADCTIGIWGIFSLNFFCISTKLPS